MTSTPLPLGMNTNSCPACQRCSSRTAFGMEIWNLLESVAVADIVVPSNRSIAIW